MRRKPRKMYTPAERAALVGEIERLYRVGGRTYAAIARELGLGETIYHNWVRRGIRASTPAVVKRAGGPAPKRYEQGERERLVKEVERLHGTGLSFKAACLELGISHSSYLSWKPVPAMRPVEVTALVPMPSVLALAPPLPVAEAVGLSLISPGGYRIEGLGVQTAAQLLRALSC